MMHTEAVAERAALNKGHRFMLKLSTMISAAALAATLAVAAQSAIPVAPATPDGKTLVVPGDHQAKGTVYCAITDKDRQIYFESNAPVEDIKGQSNDVIGYAVLSPNRPGTIVTGEWHLPVESMKMGIELRDEHLAGKTGSTRRPTPTSSSRCMSSRMSPRPSGRRPLRPTPAR